MGLYIPGTTKIAFAGIGGERAGDSCSSARSIMLLLACSFSARKRSPTHQGTSRTLLGARWSRCDRDRKNIETGRFAAVSRTTLEIAACRCIRRDLVARQQKGFQDAIRSGLYRWRQEASIVFQLQIGTVTSELTVKCALSVSTSTKTSAGWERASTKVFR